MKITTQILLIATFWTVVTTLFSQRQEALWYNKISMEEGLSSHDLNFFVHVDAEGFTWISSTSGLNRFDGHQVKQYHANFQDSTALYGENIQSQFFEDSQHNLWFCTYEAVHCYVRKKDAFQHFFLRDSAGQQIREDYLVFQLEQDSLLWVRAGQSVFRVNVGNEQQHSKAFRTARPVLHSEHFHAYAATGRDGAVQHVFLFSDEKRKGLEHFEIRQGAASQKQVYFEQTQGGTPELGIFQVYFIDPDHIWLATHAGLMEWSLAHPAQNRLFPVAFKGYSYFAPYDKRHLVVSFFGKGLYRFDQKTGIYAPYQLFPIKKSDQLRGPALRNIYLDRNQVLWVTVPFEGLIYANPAKRKFESIPNTLLSREPTLQFRNFTTDRQGQTWCSAATELFQFDPLGNLVRQIPLDAARSNKASINYVLFDNQNTLWMATSRGLYTSATPGQDIVCVPGTEDVDVLYLHQLDKLTLLATSLFGGIYEIKTRSGGYQVKNLYGEPGIGYTSMFRDGWGHIFICRNEAAIEVFRLQNGQLQSSATLPIPGAINAFWEDPDGRTLWLGTSYGLVALDKTNFRAAPVYYTVNEGLPNNNVQSIIPGNAGQLWLSTSNGLCRFDPGKKTFRTYSRADGTLSTQFYKYAGLKLRDGSIWLGGENGITVLPGVGVPDITTRADMLLTELRVNDMAPGRLVCDHTQSSQLNHIQHLTFSHDKSTLSFGFVAADYTYPKGTQVQYKLEGVDGDWVKGKAREPGFARYPNLAAGLYTFLIQGTNSDGSWNSPVHRVQIKILPPFYKTWWFIGLCALTLLGATGGFIWDRVRRFRSTEQLKRRLAENKMSALIAQMNPHFIFNSLQSVNNYILTNNRKQASEYLGRFSRLMRMILENSRHSTHSLEKEREVLELYLKVESQRFKTPFQYSIDIDETLDTYDTQVPSMMLQPFVENAIWHGLAHKAEPGSIQVSILASGEVLNCSVTDDGVGRAKAAEIALKKGKSHESRALQIITERLSLLFPRQKNQCTIEYTDLFDPNGEAAGTRVEIRLPVIA